MSLLQLKKFNPATIGDDRTIVIISKRGSGKTVASKTMCWYKRHISSGIVMNGTEAATKTYKPICPDLFIFEKWEPKQVDIILNRQKRAVNENKKLKPVFIVMDDCAYAKGIFTSETFRELIMNGRPLKICTILCVQYVMDLNPAIRENIDVLVVFKVPSKVMRKKLYDNFFSGCIDDFPTFCNILDNTTENFEALVLDNTRPTSKLSECLFWWKAKIDLPPFRMGSSKFWQHHDKNYNSKYYLEKAQPEKVTLKVVKSKKKDN